MSGKRDQQKAHNAKVRRRRDGESNEEATLNKINMPDGTKIPG
jgi:hypothetical protein